MSTGLTHHAPSSTQRDMQFSPAIAFPSLERRPRREGFLLAICSSTIVGALAELRHSRRGRRSNGVMVVARLRYLADSENLL